MPRASRAPCLGKCARRYRLLALRLRKAQAEAKARLKNNPTLKKQLDTDLQRAKQQKDNLLLLSAQRLDDPKAVADKLNQYSQEISRLEYEIAKLPGEYEPTKLAEMCSALESQMAHLRDMLKDRRNTERAREVLQHGLSLTNAKLRIFTKPDGKRDFTISGTVSLGVPAAHPIRLKTAKLWRPHGDSNPGYRRERAMS